MKEPNYFHKILAVVCLLWVLSQLCIILWHMMHGMHMKPSFLDPITMVAGAYMIWHYFKFPRKKA